MKNPFAFLLLFVAGWLVADAQVRYSFSQQGAEALITVAGKKIHGEGLVAVVITNEGTADRVVEPGEVYAMAGRAGISFILPHVAIPTVSRAKASSWPVLILDGTNIASQATGAIGLTKIVRMSNGWTLALTTGVPLVLNYVKGKVTAGQPVDSVVASDLLQAPLAVKAHSFALAFIMCRYHGDWDPKEIIQP